MKKTLVMLPYLLVNLLAFCLFPLLIKDTGTAMLIMLIAMPLVALSVACVYGIKNAFHWQYPLFVAILCIPAICMYFNYTAIAYIFIYGIIACIGNFLGNFFA